MPSVSKQSCSESSETHYKTTSLGFLLDRGSEKRARETRFMEWPELFKRFKFIRFKVFRAPRGSAATGPRGAYLFFCAAAPIFIDLYREMGTTIGNSAIVLGIIEKPI